MNAKQKGKRGERLWRDELRKAGFAADRDGQQGSGVTGSGYHPDVVCHDLNNLHSEVKFTKSLNVRKAMEQATADSSGRVPVVAWKKNNAPWLVTLAGEDFFRLVHSGSAYLKQGQRP